MSVHTADSQFSFQLPSMSYIDAKWEEPNLRTPVVAPRLARKDGLAAWLSHQLSALVAWRRNREAAAELSSMSDYELMDIGLSSGGCGPCVQPELEWRSTAARRGQRIAAFCGQFRVALYVWSQRGR